MTTTQPAPGGVRISRCSRCLPSGSSTSAIRMLSHSSSYRGFSEWTVQRMAVSIPGYLASLQRDSGHVCDPLREQKLAFGCQEVKEGLAFVGLGPGRAKAMGRP